MWRTAGAAWPQRTAAGALSGSNVGASAGPHYLGPPRGYVAFWGGLRRLATGGSLGGRRAAPVGTAGAVGPCRAMPGLGWPRYRSAQVQPSCQRAAYAGRHAARRLRKENLTARRVSKGGVRSAPLARGVGSGFKLSPVQIGSLLAQPCCPAGVGAQPGTFVEEVLQQQQQHLGARDMRIRARL